MYKMLKMKETEPIKIIFRPFLIDKIKFDKMKKDGPKIFIVSKGHNQKRFLIKNILSHFDFDCKTISNATTNKIICSNVDVEKDRIRLSESYDISDNFIHHKYDNQVLKDFLQCQKMKTIREFKNMEHKKDYRGIIIFDNCFDSSVKWSRDNFMDCLFLNSRYYKTMVLFSTQFILNIPPIYCNNVDYIFIYWNSNIEERRKIFQNYTLKNQKSIFPSFEIFCQFLEECTPYNHFLVIDNTTQSDKLEDCIFWYGPVFDYKKDRKAEYFKKHSNFFQSHVYPELIERAMHPSRIVQCMDSDFYLT